MKLGPAHGPSYFFPFLPRLGLYNIMFYFEAFVHESIIRVLYCPLPPALRTIAILLHVYSAVYDAPPTHLVYAIHHEQALVSL